MGPETSDDAGVFRISDDLALVETTDIITPLVDDPFTFGQIAAANALSDVYAMGGRPLTAMNLVFFPSCALTGEVLSEILAGGVSKIQEAGACLVGGHSVEDEELKYGLSVTGIVDPKKVVRNSTAMPGDVLVLTKPLGFGIISTAVKADMVNDAVVREACGWMTMLNRAAAALMMQDNPSACTDVTGFGLIGHCVEMARGAHVTIRLRLDSVPVIPGVAELAGDGLVPAGCYRNRDFYSQFLEAGADITPDGILPLYDPQTSGGLLIALPPEAAARLVKGLQKKGVGSALVGKVVKSKERKIKIR